MDAGGATLEAVASQDASLQRALELLPESLDAVDGTLARALPFAGALRRSLAALDEPLAKLPRTMQELPDATRGLVPLPAGELAGSSTRWPRWGAACARRRATSARPRNRSSKRSAC